MQFAPALAVLALAAAAVAVPTLELRSLPTSTVTCGSTKYSVSAISAAITQGDGYYNEGTTVGMHARTQPSAPALTPV
jgi:hypothetical protein